MREHVDYVCPGNCHYPCQFCQGGLFACSVCGCLEGATTTECPGHGLTGTQIDLIYEGVLDFRDNRWLVGVASPYTPNRRHTTATGQ